MHRWSEAFSGFMPPFKSWMPPKVIAKAAAWGDRMLGSDMSASATELSTLKYSFPDALPKVRIRDTFDRLPAVGVCCCLDSHGMHWCIDDGYFCGQASCLCWLEASHAPCLATYHYRE